MQPQVAPSRRISLRIGILFGLAAGLVGVRQWVLTAQDLAARLAAQEAILRRYPGIYGDGTPIIRGNEWYWLSTVLPTSAVILLLCFVAAGMASWMAQRQDAGVVAAWVAATVGSVLYAGAAMVAMLATPAPWVTGMLMPCVPVLLLVLLGLLWFLGRLGAALGLWVRQRFFAR